MDFLEALIEGWREAGFQSGQRPVDRKAPAGDARDVGVALVDLEGDVEFVEGLGEGETGDAGADDDDGELGGHLDFL